eukprot:SAG11_NODE_27907_length_327_cov_1.030702_2_plen_73_part_01
MLVLAAPAPCTYGRGQPYALSNSSPHPQANGLAVIFGADGDKPQAHTRRVHATPSEGAAEATKDTHEAAKAYV